MNRIGSVEYERAARIVDDDPATAHLPATDRRRLIAAIIAAIDDARVAGYGGDNGDDW